MFTRNKILKADDHQGGFTLVELLIAILLGIIVSAGVVAMAVSNVTLSNDTLNAVRLNHGLDTAMQIMVNDIRRAGYSYCDSSTNVCPNVYDNDVDPAVEVEGETILYSDNEDISIDSGGDCILYRYNSNENASKTDEYYGFRRAVVNGVGVLQMGDNTGAVTCDSDTNWVTMTDPDVLDVTTLTFASTGSKCQVVSYSASGETTVGDYWVTTSDTATGFPCLATSGAGLSTYTLVNSVYVAGTFSTPDYTDGATSSVETRHVDISLQGELVSDSTSSKTLDASVKIRNDKLRGYVLTLKFP